ncbi:AEC family transporter [Candidatus Woesearchaeota archaeon]|nr:AEC family transporter [Candidatus Woesearchaeota archaeon]
MALELILQVVAPVFLIISLGFIIGRYKKINIRVLLDFTIYIAAPCLIFYSIAESSFVFNEFFVIFFAVASVLLFGALLAYLWFKLAGLDHRGLYLPLMFPNTGNMGFPIILFAFGMEGLAKGVIYSTFTSLFLFSLGVYIVARKANLKEVFRLPLIYAVVLGILFSVLNLKLPLAVMNPVKMLGDTAIPLQLIILGFSLSSVKIKSIKLSVLGAIFKFISAFLIALAFVSIFGISGLTRKVILLQSIMPSALFCIILSEKYNRDSSLVASTVFISTLLSIITIPLVLFFL